MMNTKVRVVDVQCVRHASSRIPQGYNIWEYGDDENEKCGMTLSYYYQLLLARKETTEETIARLRLHVQLVQKSQARHVLYGIDVKRMFTWTLHQRFLSRVAHLFDFGTDELKELLRQANNAYKAEQRRKHEEEMHVTSAIQESADRHRDLNARYKEWCAAQGIAPTRDLSTPDETVALAVRFCDLCYTPYSGPGKMHRDMDAIKNRDDSKPLRLCPECYEMSFKRHLVAVERTILDTSQAELQAMEEAFARRLIQSVESSKGKSTP